MTVIFDLVGMSTSLLPFGNVFDFAVGQYSFAAWGAAMVGTHFASTIVGGQQKESWNFHRKLFCIGTIGIGVFLLLFIAVHLGTWMNE